MDTPTAMKDPESGNLLTTEAKIQEAAVRVYCVYIKRLTNRPIKDDLIHIKDAKEILCEKLTLSKNKCHSVHIGNKLIECNQLKVHGSDMMEFNQETYLKDTIDKSGKIRPNIGKRKAKGYDIVSEINVPLAHWKVPARLKLRQAMLVNGTLFNSETWHSVSVKDILLLERVDEALLK